MKPAVVDERDHDAEQGKDDTAARMPAATTTMATNVPVYLEVGRVGVSSGELCPEEPTRELALTSGSTTRTLSW
jgi:hypothetical protein